MDMSYIRAVGQPTTAQNGHVE